MNDLKWFFPESGSECLNLFNEGIRPHGGGTFLVKTALNIRGLFTASTVEEYRRLSAAGASASIGAAATYAGTAAFLESVQPGNFISAALSSAASTPLRNRITIGGSIVSSPKWTDTASALAAAGSSVIFEGGEQVLFADYTSNRKLRMEKLVASVVIPLKNINGRYYRFTLTGFDYPFFTAAVSKTENHTMTAVVSGCRDGLLVFSGKSSDILEQAESGLSFNRERGISGEYIKHRALTELNRLTGGNKE